MSYPIFFRITFLLCFVVTIFGCGKKEESAGIVPPEIMSEETFTRVLTDFALAESASNMNIKNANLQKLDSMYAFNPLEDNGVTQAQYDSALVFYVRHPQLYRKVYENVLVNLNEIQLKRNPAIKDTASK